MTIAPALGLSPVAPAAAPADGQLAHRPLVFVHEVRSMTRRSAFPFGS
ncbi:hypothetical protein [Streptomyces sp. NPDC059649]